MSRRTFGTIAQRRMGARALPPSSDGTAPPARPEATVVAPVPVLQVNERDAVRALETATNVALRLLSESDMGDDASEWLGDNVKPYLDTANWMLRKLLKGQS